MTQFHSNGVFQQKWNGIWECLLLFLALVVKYTIVVRWIAGPHGLYNNTARFGKFMIETEIYLKQTQYNIPKPACKLPYVLPDLPDLQIGSRNDNNQQNTHDFPIFSLRTFRRKRWPFFNSSAPDWPAEKQMFSFSLLNYKVSWMLKSVKNISLFFVYFTIRVL